MARAAVLKLRGRAFPVYLHFDGVHGSQARSLGAGLSGSSYLGGGQHPTQVWRPKSLAGLKPASDRGVEPEHLLKLGSHERPRVHHESAMDDGVPGLVGATTQPTLD